VLSLARALVTLLDDIILEGDAGSTVFDRDECDDPSGDLMNVEKFMPCLAERSASEVT
jgi:hypothetical protein